jgi:hypothetical protein
VLGGRVDQHRHVEGRAVQLRVGEEHGGGEVPAAAADVEHPPGRPEVVGGHGLGDDGERERRSSWSSTVIGPSASRSARRRRAITWAIWAGA